LFFAQEYNADREARKEVEAEGKDTEDQGQSTLSRDIKDSAQVDEDEFTSQEQDGEQAEPKEENTDQIL
jgi:hypothetical protein